MDLRSVKPGLAASTQYPLFLLDPRTREMITPMTWGKSGNPVFPVAGGSGEGESEDADADAEDADEEDANDESDDDAEDDSDDDSDDDKGKKKKKGNPEAKIKALEEEKDRHYRNAKKYKRQAAELEARLKALEDKDLKPEDKDKRDKADQEAKDKLAQAATQKLRLENAFLRANDIDWIKPEQALALLLADPDEYEVEFDDSGNVDRKSLRAELKRLAKANPHLVKPKQSKGKDDEEDADDAGSQRQTASSMNGNRKGKIKAKTREELAKRYPALNRLGS